jgi:hypothetical protein
VLRFDSNVGASLLGGSSRFSGTFGVSAGLHDDFEIGAVPAGWVWFLSLPDPYFYVRGRFLSGEVQLSGRLDLYVPVSQSDTQVGGALELAWRATDFMRLHADLDVQIIIGEPVYSRVSVPIRAIFQAGPNAFDVTTGLLVFNDFDDVDVPLFVGWTFAWRGLHQGPLADVRLEGGLLDLSQPDLGFRVFGKWTFYAYL